MGKAMGPRALDGETVGSCPVFTVGPVAAEGTTDNWSQGAQCDHCADSPEHLLTDQQRVAACVTIMRGRCVTTAFEN